MEVIAKVDGYHPLTGLYLVAGESYTIDPEQFRDDVFEQKEIKKTAAKPAAGGE